MNFGYLVGIIGLILTPIAKRRGLKSVAYPVLAWSATLIVPLVFYFHDYNSRDGGLLYVSDAPDIFFYAYLGAFLFIISTILSIIAIVKSKNH